MKNNLAVAMGRVSTLNQAKHGLSLADQDLLFPQYANQQGHTLVKVFSFNESAATSEKRVYFREVIQYAKDNDIGHFYVEDTERLSRDLVDYQFVKDLVENYSVRFHFIRDGYTLDKNYEGASKFNFIIRMGMAENDIDRLRKKMRAKMLYKVQNGEWPMRPLFGYDIIEKKLIPNKYAETVKELYQRRLRGATLRELCSYLITEKIQPPRGTEWNFQAVQKMLKQIGYTGRIKWKDTIYPATHQPLISDALFYKVQDTFAQTSRKNVKDQHFFSGLIRLPSGRLFSPELKKGHVYYSAYTARNGPRVWLKESELMGQVDDMIASLHWPSEFGQWIRSASKEIVQHQRGTAETRITQKERELSELRGKDGRLYEDRLEGTIPKDLYMRKSAEIRQRIVTVEAELNGLKKDDREFMAHLAALTDTFETLSIKYKAADKATRRQIIRLLVKSFTIDERRQLVPTFNLPYSIFIGPTIDALIRSPVRDSYKIRPLVDEFRTFTAA